MPRVPPIIDRLMVHLYVFVALSALCGFQGVYVGPGGQYGRDASHQRNTSKFLQPSLCPGPVKTYRDQSKNTQHFVKNIKHFKGAIAEHSHVEAPEFLPGPNTVPGLCGPGGWGQGVEGWGHRVGEGDL